jgi:peptide/nickel transport system ATP-binding protein
MSNRHITPTDTLQDGPHGGPLRVTGSDATAGRDATPLLEVRGLKMHFPITKGFFNRTVGQVKAVDDVSFSIRDGETVGLVGESGCGKTTTGRCILRILDPTEGQILYRQTDDHVVDLATLPHRRLKPFRRDIRLIFQDPHSSLNPRLPVLDIVGEPLRINRIATGSELEDRVTGLLQKVGLRPEYIKRYPHAFSGGERQRIGIARALALNPRLVVCDEAVSALDVSVQAQTINLLQDLQQEFGLTYLFVAHDLSVVEHISDRVAVMYVGRLVETAATDDLFQHPRHPYTEALLSAVPQPDPRLRSKGTRIRLAGEVVDPARLPAGCAFHPRCTYADHRCRTETPPLRQVAPGHHTACHHAETLELRGVTSG